MSIHIVSSVVYDVCVWGGGGGGDSEIWRGDCVIYTNNHMHSAPQRA